MSDDAPPERPTQRPASLRTRAAVAESPLNRPVQGGETVDELADDEKLSRVVANYIGTHMLNIVKDLVAQPDPHAHYPVILRFEEIVAFFFFHLSSSQWRFPAFFTS